MVIIIILAVMMAGCPSPDSEEPPEPLPATYTVTYDGNGNTGGTVPTDSNTYRTFQMVTVLGNMGSLVKSGAAFEGFFGCWNTASDGNGTNYALGDTFAMRSLDVTLYAKWGPVQKISSTERGFTGVLDDTDHFGDSVANLGDLDGDGVQDLAVGASSDDDGGNARGAVWVLFLDADGTVKSHQKISSTEGGFTGVLDDNDFFGRSAAGLGDLDGDGVQDLAVGTEYDDDGGAQRGAVWVLFLNANGTVKGDQKISDTEGAFEGVLDDSDYFGCSVASLGDLDGDGVQD